MLFEQIQHLINYAVLTFHSILFCNGQYNMKHVFTILAESLTINVLKTVQMLAQKSAKCVHAVGLALKILFRAIITQ